MKSSTNKFSSPAIRGGIALSILCVLSFVASFFLSASPDWQFVLRFSGLALLFVGLLFTGFGYLVRTANKTRIKDNPDYKPWEHSG